ncbi:MAG: hypothetical protein U0457_12570 [Candidatus Sericytochromatia bacterium]
MNENEFEFEVYDSYKKKLIKIAENEVGRNFCCLKNKYVVYTKNIFGYDILPPSDVYIFDLETENNKIILKDIDIRSYNMWNCYYDNNILPIFNEKYLLIYYKEYYDNHKCDHPFIFNTDDFSLVETEFDFDVNSISILENDLYYSLKELENAYELEIGSLFFEE